MVLIGNTMENRIRWKREPFGIIAMGIIFISLILFSHVAEKKEYATVIFYTANNEITFNCDIADSMVSRTKGLLGTTYLNIDEGMIFVYDTADIRTFHMNGMNFPADIVFIDSQYKVLNIVEANISDEHIMSNGPAQYVVEINKGLCKQYGIFQGVKVTIIRT
jgi:uncharacterized membrane protein (UPF0127 family)